MFKTRELSSVSGKNATDQQVRFAFLKFPRSDHEKGDAKRWTIWGGDAKRKANGKKNEWWWETLNDLRWVSQGKRSREARRSLDQWNVLPIGTISYHMPTPLQLWQRTLKPKIHRENPKDPFRFTCLSPKHRSPYDRRSDDNEEKCRKMIVNLSFLSFILIGKPSFPPPQVPSQTEFILGLSRLNWVYFGA
jgi:hypothetical protein